MILAALHPYSKRVFTLSCGNFDRLVVTIAMLHACVFLVHDVMTFDDPTDLWYLDTALCYAVRLVIALVKDNISHPFPTLRNALGQE